MMQQHPKSSSSFGTVTIDDAANKTVSDIDEEDRYIQDQLPSVEDVRTYAAQLNASADIANRGSRRRLLQRPPRQVIKWLFYAGIFLLVVSMITLIVGLTTTNNNKGDTITVDRSQVETFLVRQGFSTLDELMDDQSPQYKAVSWLVDQDGSGRVAVPTLESVSSYTAFLQRYVLVVLYYATQGGGGWSTTWNLLTPNRQTCDWWNGGTTADGRLFRFGASCSTGGVVTEIHIPQTNLAGEIPRELAYLTDLRFLALSHNALTGTIPDDFKNLENLDYLALHVNLLTGELEPWWGGLTNLRVLGLGDNGLEGSIPEAFLQLKKMITLGLDNNGFEGDFRHLQDMKSMERLYLNDNEFGTTLTATYLVDMRYLEEFDISGNAFEGTLPKDFFHYPKLRILDLSANALSGALPAGTYNNPVLEYLALDHNKFSGPILESMANLSNLTHLDLAGNELTGFIPTDVTTKMTNLRYLFLADNPTLSAAEIPNLSALKHLKDVSFKSTQRTGEIPDYFPQSNPDLVLLDLDNNNLTGLIPQALGGNPRLQYLLLNRNEGLTGEVPMEIQLLPRLKILLLSRTSIEGNLNTLCSRPPTISILESVSADCDGVGPEVFCKCCDICCQDDTDKDEADRTCRKTVFYGDIDPVWEHSFARRDYEFKRVTITEDGGGS